MLERSCLSSFLDMKQYAFLADPQYLSVELCKNQFIFPKDYDSILFGFENNNSGSWITMKTVVASS